LSALVGLLAVIYETHSDSFEKEASMLAEFKAFLLRGNVIDLAWRSSLVRPSELS
jgi:hypothetical protein